jgi:hypothetical protein
MTLLRDSGCAVDDKDCFFEGWLDIGIEAASARPATRSQPVMLPSFIKSGMMKSLTRITSGFMKHQKNARELTTCNLWHIRFPGKMVADRCGLAGCDRSGLEGQNMGVEAEYKTYYADVVGKPDPAPAAKPAAADKPADKPTMSSGVADVKAAPGTILHGDASFPPATRFWCSRRHSDRPGARFGGRRRPAGH